MSGWRNVETWDIPSVWDMGAVLKNGAKRTTVEMILNIQGGTLPDRTAVIWRFREIQLDQPGHLAMKIQEADDELISGAPWGSLRPTSTQSRHLSIALDKALLVPDYDGMIYTQEVKGF